jgi:hypothetical protein
MKKLALIVVATLFCTPAHAVVMGTTAGFSSLRFHFRSRSSSVWFNEFVPTPAKVPESRVWSDEFRDQESAGILVSLAIIHPTPFILDPSGQRCRRRSVVALMSR